MMVSILFEYFLPDFNFFLYGGIFEKLQSEVGSSKREATFRTISAPSYKEQLNTILAPTTQVHEHDDSFNSVLQ